MAEFVHLHNHTDYSLLDGAASVKSLVAKAKSLNMNHVAITDHGNMFGALRFYKECRDAGINPLIGCEFYVTPGSRFLKTGTESGNNYYHLVLLAQDEAGYQNLITLCSAAYTEGFYYKPRIDDELLSAHSGSLICLSACLAGEIPSLILAGQEKKAVDKALAYRDLFGKDKFYLELQEHGIPEQRTVNRTLVDIAKKTGIPLVCTNDTHYTDREDANAQDILICIGTNKKRDEQNRMRFPGSEFYLKSADEMARIFSEVPESVRNAVAIAEMCKLSINLPGPLLPDYAIPPGFSGPEDFLRHLTMEGLRKRYGDVLPELKARAEYELDIIIRMGFTGYFLIVWDFIDFAKNHGIPVGPGRGSGAGSIVAYSLRITDIDPIKYNLLFERFLNPERVSMPDFDIDFCFVRRQEVIDYVTEKYGKDRVGQIITFGTLKAKAVVRDVARVLDIPYAEADTIAKLVPEGPKVSLKKALEQEPKLKEMTEKNGIYKELMEASLKLEGLNRHPSTHAAGIVIGKEALTKYVPLYRDPKTGSVSTQYTMEQLEDCGLVKMDFLGLKTLTLIQNTEALIRKRIPDFSIRNIPECDKKTFDLLGEGKSTCIFQFESSGMQAVLKQAKPTSIEDLIALNALYRPGPMDNIPQFIDCKWGRKPITYPLPALEPILKETYGVIVYQEQVMEIARVVAGYSLGQADLLRRAMGKKKAEEMAKQKTKFIEGAKKNGYSEKKADELFELLVPFAGYGFNKSHAAAYAVLAYQTAYLKANFPAEFMAANLTNEINALDTLAEYIEETRGMGIEVLPPHVNSSDKYFSVKEGKIVYGLIGIKNVGDSAVDEIIRARETGGPYTSLTDFLERVDLKVVNRKVLETLIQSGALDDGVFSRAALFSNLDRALAFVTQKKESKKFGQVSLFESMEKEVFPGIELEPVEEWPHAELLRFEKENLGFYFSGHPMDKYKKMWQKVVTLDLSKLDRAQADKTYHLIGTIKTMREIQTKTGKRMAFAQFEDFNGSIELVIFSDAYEKYRERLKKDVAIGITGKVDFQRGEAKFKVEEVKNPEDLPEQEAREVHIRISPDMEESDAERIRDFVLDKHGNCSVYIHIRKQGKEFVIKASNSLSLSSHNDVLSVLKTYPRIQEVWKE